MGIAGLPIFTSAIDAVAATSALFGFITTFSSGFTAAASRSSPRICAAVTCQNCSFWNAVTFSGDAPVATRSIGRLMRSRSSPFHCGLFSASIASPRFL